MYKTLASSSSREPDLISSLELSVVLMIIKQQKITPCSWQNSIRSFYKNWYSENCALPSHLHLTDK